ncbi:hypothetical protein [Mycolicibacterium austroafricanum]|uniref:hypothetical protein n=1 Tax=Mycolicibacterium austroafricanum TaxID=39687 RepID=UPI001CA32D48|nr:hypothetical protein [Mycolicibacterium austroafricanum]QZT61296.1 hypothetical protein JN085_20230 [Mycolicibacterium austroafricanum]
MSPHSIAADKNRIITQLWVNLQNMPDDPDECAALFPQTAAQVGRILDVLYEEDFRPAEMQALLSIIGPVLSRTSLAGPRLPHRRSLRAV